MRTSFVIGSSLVVAACGATQPDATSETDQAVTATTQTTSIPLHLATPAPLNLGGFTIGGAAAGSPIEFDITGQADWSSTVNTDISWDTDKVRQGATVSVGRNITSITGDLVVTWSLTGKVTLPDPVGLQTFGPFSFAADHVSCVPNLAPQTIATGGGGTAVMDLGNPCDATGNGPSWCFGVSGDDGSVAGGGGTTQTTDSGNGTFDATAAVLATGVGGPMLGSVGGQFVANAASIDSHLPSYLCTASGSKTLFESLGLPGPYVDLTMAVQFQIVQQKATATEQFVIADATLSQSDFDLTPGAASDSHAMPCDRPVGSDVQYVISNVDWQPASVLATQQAFLTIGPTDGFGDHSGTLSFSAPITNPMKEAMKVELTGDGDTLDLGALQANNVLPTVTAGPFSGFEGLPMTLSETASSACPITSYAWTFSNGHNAFGPTPAVLFGPHGQYSGQLVVTDATHLSQTADFSVSIANVPPVAFAGPPTSGAWGTQIALVGQASDPGGDPLTYSWDFGDGTRGVGGTTAQHAYATPGDYVATFTACDDFHACGSASTPVHVRTRRTSVALTGGNTGVFSAQAQLSGAIVDELGLPVVGGTLAFTLAGNAAGSAQTDSTGTATSQQTIGLPAGTYATTATFGGSPFYDGGAAAGSFAVSRMTSTVAYTGATSGIANKTVALSAKLADALGGPLANETIVFQLGTQQAQATTDANGIAATSLALSQKNGSYALKTTWTPAGSDATKWTGTSASGTFTIGSVKK